MTAGTARQAMPVFFCLFPQVPGRFFPVFSNTDNIQDKKRLPPKWQP